MTSLKLFQTPSCKWLIHADVVVEVTRTAQPIVSEGEIGIPRQHAPLARVPSLSR